jgi:NodT family efflux transporter outer membrane factor (OMF) lipoprotein
VRRADAITAGGVLAALVAGCSFAPPYHVPRSPSAPAEYKEQAGWKVAEPRDSAARGDWWSMFEDPELDRLEQKLHGDNLSLKAAYARLEQARAQYRIARADLFPTITANPQATREKLSTHQPRFIAGFPSLYNDFVAGADFSYELDLWGRVRNEVAEARANRQASAADLINTELMLRAELAVDYFTLRTDDAQTQVIDQTTEAYGRSLELTSSLFKGGAAALSDVAQSQAQLETARTQAAEIRLQRAQTEHAIAVLLGENPSTFSLPPRPLPLEVTPPPVDPGLPSALLERRPDIAEAERRVAAANAAIGEARAAYFPQFKLLADAGFESTRPGNWFTAPSEFWAFGPQVTMPIFEGGRLRAATARARAAFDEQVANYRNSVLTAYQDVEDNLAALRQLQVEAQTDQAAVEATATALDQAQKRYEAGIITYLEVATAQTAALQAQLAAVSIQSRRMSAAVLLIKALGGGWQNPRSLAAAASKSPDGGGR